MDNPQPSPNVEKKSTMDAVQRLDGGGETQIQKNLQRHKKLYTWNQNQTRTIPFDANQRFDGDELHPRSRNQHSTISMFEDFEQTYRWLISTTKVIESLPRGHFKCWIPEGTGIQKAGKYKKLSFSGDYYMCHVFVWLFHHPKQIYTDDISHLCSNEGCCRPSHLFREDRNTNISRRGCSGYLVSDDDKEPIIRLCQHNPPCTKTTLKPREYVSLEFE